MVLPPNLAGCLPISYVANFDELSGPLKLASGGCRDHTELHVKQRLNAAGRYNPRIPDNTIALVRELARLMPDRQIARLLNRTGVKTGHGNAWTQERVSGFRQHYDIAVFRDGEWAERGDIKGRQACAGAPWVIRAEDLAGFADDKRRKLPLTQNATQQIFDFQ